jgi:nicotinate phosphoribosyltransferase
MSHLATPQLPSSLLLLTDLYQLTMACGYWRAGMADREAVFHLFFRTQPFRSGYTVAAGLELAVDYLRSLQLSPEDAAYLATLRGSDDKALFDAEFLSALGAMDLGLDVDAVPEGTVVFPSEPLLRIRGPIIACQLVESALLNILNFSSLIATKAARICGAAKGEPVMEFGLRRAQGIDGALTASRAAYIGGCTATSNVLAGRLFGIPVKGTHAHSWVMCFESELEAFRTYAEAMPNNATFLVDTYDTLEGVRHAIEVGFTLRERGQRFLGIRLDSGDLAWLSKEARKLLDEAGFTETVIVASNDLDEHLIESLKGQGACIGAWGVGTKLVTAYDQPALGGVYKLGAIRKLGDPWSYRIKLSEQLIKISNPGIQQVRRFFQDGKPVGDAIYDLENPPLGETTIVDPTEMIRHKSFERGTEFVDLLQPVMRGGKFVGEQESLEVIRARAAQQISSFDETIRRLDNPHRYPAGLELGLHERKLAMVHAAREVGK